MGSDERSPQQVLPQTSNLQVLDKTDFPILMRCRSSPARELTEPGLVGADSKYRYMLVGRVARYSLPV